MRVFLSCFFILIARCKLGITTEGEEELEFFVTVGYLGCLIVATNHQSDFPAPVNVHVNRHSTTILDETQANDWLLKKKVLTNPPLAC